MTIVKNFSSVNKKQQQPNIIIVFVKRTSVLKVQLTFFTFSALKCFGLGTSRTISSSELEQHDFTE